MFAPFLVAFHGVEREVEGLGDFLVGFPLEAEFVYALDLGRELLDGFVHQVIYLFFDDGVEKVLFVGDGGGVSQVVFFGFLMIQVVEATIPDREVKKGFEGVDVFERAFFAIQVEDSIVHDVFACFNIGYEFHGEVRENPVVFVK